ncbi:hypothetical protein [Brunnivagina elsteri]|nr:hypothetical protein [Calothrix elsteri]
MTSKLAKNGFNRRLELLKLKATPGFEPGDGGFADLGKLRKDKLFTPQL